MKNIKNVLLIALISSIAIVSCKKSDYDAGSTATQAMSGDWFVKIYTEDMTDLTPDYWGVDYLKVTTYNTAANVPTEMFFDDLKSWPLKCKVQVTPASLTFQTSDFVDNYYKE